MQNIQKGGVKLGSGSYGTVYGEPGLPAINNAGEMPDTNTYVSKVFLRIRRSNGHHIFDEKANSDARNENNARDFLAEHFPGNLELLSRYLVIPWGHFYINAEELKKPQLWSIYYNSNWLAPAGETVNRQRYGVWLRQALGGIRYEQVITEKGKSNLGTIFRNHDDFTNLNKRVAKTINILEGIQLLQTKNIIHADLKPDNCLNTAEDIYKMIDLADITRINDINSTQVDANYENFAPPGTPPKWVFTKFINKKTNIPIEGILPMMPEIATYWIWPTIVCIFSARAWPADETEHSGEIVASSLGTGGAPLTYEKFIQNWKQRERENNANIQYQQITASIIRSIIQTVGANNTVLGIATPGPPPGAAAGAAAASGGGEDIPVTGRMFIKNIENTLLLREVRNGYKRDYLDEWYDKNIDWNQTNIITLFKRIDIYSFGILLLKCITRPYMKIFDSGQPFSQLQLNYFTKVLQLLAQCMVVLPQHIMQIDPVLVAELKSEGIPAVQEITTLYPGVAAAAAAAALAIIPDSPIQPVESEDIASAIQHDQQQQVPAVPSAPHPPPSAPPLTATEISQQGGRTKRIKRRTKKRRNKKHRRSRRRRLK